MARGVHEVTSARADLAAALNASAGVREIKVGKGALKKLVAQTEALLDTGERVEFGAYHYERGLTMVTYFVIVVTDRRVLRVNRTTWKLAPFIVQRDSVTSAEVAATGAEPQVTLHRGEAVIAPFRLARADAERLVELFSPAG